MRKYFSPGDVVTIAPDELRFSVPCSVCNGKLGILITLAFRIIFI